MTDTDTFKESRQPVREVPLLLRIIWFFVLGWELTAVWILIAWALNLSIIGLPLGLWMIDRVPQVLTLKGRSGSWVTNSKSGDVRYEGAAQTPFLLRALYFLLVGWWFSLIWAIVAYLLCLTIIGAIIGIPMLNALPMVTTLHRN